MLTRAVINDIELTDANRFALSMLYRCLLVQKHHLLIITESQSRCKLLSRLYNYQFLNQNVCVSPNWIDIFHSVLVYVRVKLYACTTTGCTETLYSNPIRTGIMYYIVSFESTHRLIEININIDVFKYVCELNGIILQIQ